MLKIYLTRHGETLWNTEKRLQGWKDSELTEKGVNSALRLGDRLFNTEFNAIYTSPSQRAFQTAKYIAGERNIPIFMEENLKELYFGAWEGRNEADIEQNYKNEYYNFWNLPHLYNHKLHQGESLTDLKRRVVESFNRIISENHDGNVLIVSHAVAIKTIISYVMNKSIENLWDPPFIYGTSLSIFNWDGEKMEVQMLGDTSHLATC
ncbi:histidine phosphatase family protein [Neobacillus sp. LXY-1]|uniref:histidine phosphatase family protein n=1 Tax=Neobacillus sp. LXY-1 TaxID=3379133 RepID=UPI003EDFF38F